MVVQPTNHHYRREYCNTPVSFNRTVCGCRLPTKNWWTTITCKQVQAGLLFLKKNVNDDPPQALCLLFLSDHLSQGQPQPRPSLYRAFEFPTHIACQLTMIKDTMDKQLHSAYVTHTDEYKYYQINCFCNENLAAVQPGIHHYRHDYSNTQVSFNQTVCGCHSHRLRIDELPSHASR